MSLDHILLGLLREPASGYDLKRVFDERISHFWAAELSQIYPTLRRLEERGLLRGRQVAARRGPGRRLYAITPEGRRALRAWLRGEPQFGDERFAYIAQLHLMDELGDVAQTIRFVRRLRDYFSSKLAALRAIDRDWVAADPRYPDALPLQEFHIHLTLRKGLYSLEAHIRWCDECLSRLRARAPSTDRATAGRPARR
jgi:PadR family transcriptional regulator, phenolic acid-responsive transcriptional regulator